MAENSWIRPKRKNVRLRVGGKQIMTVTVELVRVQGMFKRGGEAADASYISKGGEREREREREREKERDFEGSVWGRCRW